MSHCLARVFHQSKKTEAMAELPRQRTSSRPRQSEVAWRGMHQVYKRTMTNFWAQNCWRGSQRIHEPSDRIQCYLGYLYYWPHDGKVFCYFDTLTVGHQRFPEMCRQNISKSSKLNAIRCHLDEWFGCFNMVDENETRLDEIRQYFIQLWSNILLTFCVKITGSYWIPIYNWLVFDLKMIKTLCRHWRYPHFDGQPSSSPAAPCQSSWSHIKGTCDCKSRDIWEEREWPEWQCQEMVRMATLNFKTRFAGSEMSKLRTRTTWGISKSEVM